MSLETATSVVRPDEWPIGLKYKPSKEDFVRILKKKLADEEIRYEKVVVLDSGDLYSDTPDVLFHEKPFSYKNRFVVVTRRKPNAKGGFIRQLPSPGFTASWDPCSDLSAILAREDDTFIGVYQSYNFCYGKVKEGSGKVPTCWYMVEIQTVDPDCPLAISVVYKVPDPKLVTALKAQNSANKNLRRAKKRKCIADYQAMIAANLALVADKGLEEAILTAADVAKKKQKEEERTMLGGGKRKTDCDQEAGLSNPPRKIKIRLTHKKSDQENL